jgi:hypothetical protein
MVFYDRAGKAVAYCEDGSNIYLFGGAPIAYIEVDCIYSFGGKHLGWFMAGWIIDHDGGNLLFTEDASGGPVTPVKSVPPIKAVKRVLPVKHVTQIAPVTPVRRLGWSSYTTNQFFGL